GPGRRRNGPADGSPARGRRDPDDPGYRGRHRGEEGTGRAARQVGGGQAEGPGRPQRQAEGGESARDRSRQVTGVRVARRNEEPAGGRGGRDRDAERSNPRRMGRSVTGGAAGVVSGGSRENENTR